MSRSLDPTTLENINKDVVRPFNAVELLFDGTHTDPDTGLQVPNTLRIWTGVGNLVLDGVVWIGAGTLLSISSIEETAEMAVKGATVSLSGIPSEVISLALSEPYQGRVCNIYFGTISESGALLKQSGDYILLQDGSQILVDTGTKGLNEIFSGYMDQMNIEESADTSTIEVTVENRLVDLERARVARYTSGYQKSIYPDDLGLDFIEDLQDKQVAWGRKSGS
tara:strand:+ start:2493 stop:3161 length:669 start_codon:yes stop_codon:yes gene_type:complete